MADHSGRIVMLILFSVALTVDILVGNQLSWILNLTLAFTHGLPVDIGGILI